MLTITNLNASVRGDDDEEEKKILQDFNLAIGAGEVHAIMGPNGAGKSTLSYVLTGRPGYEVTSGQIAYQGTSLIELGPEERAAKGVFLSFQYPLEIPGVPVMTFLRTSVNALRSANKQTELSASDFLKIVRQRAAELDIKEEMLRRPLNMGFSGGEKKRMEMLQMAMLEPKFVILDETDSGLDIDALKIVAQTVNAMRDEKRSFLIITHYQRLLDHIQPDHVHIMNHGQVIKSGNASLAVELERSGYESIIADSGGAQ